ncbi:TPA: UvrD-helicase domain-containing protein [Clostridioides difficile]|nr:UvrD-helicase domain-containing protein [Clostridioides difficile]HBF0842744.1 UvrD-helicase domain-containing protein [Clostridioides difficile]HBF4444264.1 UvrD-helicase domain-containing protein [Clostridioides difficile]
MGKIEPNQEDRIYEDLYQGNSAEGKVCEWIEESINDDCYVGQHRFKIETRECDIAMVIPNRGILIIEVKGYTVEMIDHMSSNFIIHVKKEYENERFKTGERHPAEQANDYVFTMMRDFSGFLKRNNICLPICKIGRMAAMPNMTDKEYEELYLDYCYSTKLVITKDWFKNKNIFYHRFIKALNIIFNSISSEVDFDDSYYNIARRYILLSERKKYVDLCKEQLKREEELGIDFIIDNTNEEVDQLCKSNEVNDEEMELIKFSSVLQEELTESHKLSKIIPYSKLRIVKTGCEIEPLLEICCNERKEGIKQFLILVNFTRDEKEKILLEYEKRFLNKYKENELLFLFNMYFIDLSNDDTSIDNLFSNHDNIEIINGERIEEIVKIKPDNFIVQEFTPKDLLDQALWNILCIADNFTSFNFDQYIVEHSPLRQNIVVTASAGTGKTYTMVDRVSFVAHMEIIYRNSKESISDLISMITFTNNSTDEMKERLMKHFMQYFELTHNKVYMDLLEQLGRMKIKTIDSFTKYILSKFAHLLGLSNSFSLKSGKFELENILRKYINDEITKEIIDDFHNINIYEIANHILALRSFLINRKIQFDKVKHASIVGPDVGKGTIRMKNFIESVLISTNSEYDSFNCSQNFISMNELVIQLEKVKNKLIKTSCINNTKENYEKYLFIDEFQDTDNKQIQLIRFFADYFNIALFVVGDEKQCIYGFRGAERTSFLELTCVDTNFQQRNWISCFLRKNYRTEEPLVKKINEVFSKMPNDFFPYQNKDKLVAQKGIGRIYSGCYEQFKYSENNLIELVDNCVKRMKKNNEDGQIAILTRNNYEVDQIRALFGENKEYEIKFDNGGLFYNTDAVIDFYKLVEFLMNTEDGAKRYSILETPYSDFRIKESKIKLYQAYEKMDVETFEIIRSGNNHVSLRKYYDVLYNYGKKHPNLKNSPSLKILRMIVNEIKPWEHYVPERYKTVDFNDICNQNKLIEARNEYRQNLFQLFQKLIDDNKTDYLTLNKIHQILTIGIFAMQDIDIDLPKNNFFGEKISVLCTTVHKSKGLQYHTVIMPFTMNDITESRGSTQFIYREDTNEIYMQLKEADGKCLIYESTNFDCENNKKNETIQSEELRILYVALTRSKKFFYFMVDEERFEKNNTSKKNCWAHYLM